MAQCTERYLPLCTIPPRMSKDGWAGSNAKIYLPFIGFVFFSGATFTPVGDTAAQDDKMYLGGLVKGGVYSKEGCYCGGQP